MENTENLSNERYCLQELSLHKFFFFPIENKIGDISGVVK